MRGKNKVVFKRTDQINSLVKEVVSEYHEKKGLPKNKKIIRWRTKQMLVAIESGFNEIPLSAVKVK